MANHDMMLSITGYYGDWRLAAAGADGGVDDDDDVYVWNAFYAFIRAYFIFWLTFLSHVKFLIFR